MNPLKWVFELYDKMSGPARKMSADLMGVDRALKTSGQSAQGFQRDLVQGASSVSLWVTGLNQAVDLLGRLGSALGAVGRSVFDFGAFAVKTLAFKETTQESLKLLLGDEKKANEFFQQAVKRGAETPFSTSTVLNSFKELLSAGFAQDEVDVAFRGLGDVAAMAGFDENVISGVTRQLAQMKATGKATLMDLRPITTWTAAAGIGLGQIGEQWGKMTGKDPKGFLDAVSAGAIDANTVIFALFAAIKAKFGELGGNMKTQAQTLTGLWSTLSSAPQDFLFKLDKMGRVDQMRGFKELKAAMRNAIAVFDPESAAGRRIAGFLERTLGGSLQALFGGFAGADGLERIEGVVRRVVQGFELVSLGVRSAWSFAEGFVSALTAGIAPLSGVESVFGPDGSVNPTAVKTLTTSFQEMGREVGFVVAQVVELVRTLGRAAEMLGNLIPGGGTGRAAGFAAGVGRSLPVVGPMLGYVQDKLLEGAARTMAGMGANQSKSLVDGYLSAAPAMSRAGGVLGEYLENGTRDALDIHSPSRVFEDLGEYSAKGFEVGLTKRGAFGGGLRDALTSSLSGSTGTNMGGVTIHVPVTVYGDGNPESIREAVERGIESAMERMALSMGGLGAGGAA